MSALLPAAGRVLEHLVPSLFEQQQRPVRLIQQVSDVDPQVFGLVPSGCLAPQPPGASVGLPDLSQQCCRLRDQLWQVWWTVPQAQPGVRAQFAQFMKSF